jgi:RNA polymerase subunit RPABC4/transcription elongation factor Spt4
MSGKGWFGKGDADSEQEAQLKKEIKEAIASITHDAEEEKEIEEVRKALRSSTQTVKSPPVPEKKVEPLPEPVPEQRPPPPPVQPRPAPPVYNPPPQQPIFVPPPVSAQYDREWLSCARCGRVVGENDRICNACGSPLFKMCPQCGKPARVKMRFCIQCGRRFEW